MFRERLSIAQHALGPDHWLFFKLCLGYEISLTADDDAPLRAPIWKPQWLPPAKPPLDRGALPALTAAMLPVAAALGSGFRWPAEAHRHYVRLVAAL